MSNEQNSFEACMEGFSKVGVSEGYLDRLINSPTANAIISNSNSDPAANDLANLRLDLAKTIGTQLANDVDSAITACREAEKKVVDNNLSELPKSLFADAKFANATLDTTKEKILSAIRQVSNYLEDKGEARTCLKNAPNFGAVKACKAELEK